MYYFVLLPYHCHFVSLEVQYYKQYSLLILLPTSHCLRVNTRSYGRLLLHLVVTKRIIIVSSCGLLVSFNLVIDKLPLFAIVFFYSFQHLVCVGYFISCLKIYGSLYFLVKILFIYTSNKPISHIQMKTRYIPQTIIYNSTNLQNILYLGL